ncbi:MAG: hypothetical protein LBD99_02990 [Candidatus Margulisbacteria bacterium]|nr:hypothetical protein [Candidatus Margulisiibacteriota bacterium]
MAGVRFPTTQDVLWGAGAPRNNNKLPEIKNKNDPPKNPKDPLDEYYLKPKKTEKSISGFLKDLSTFLENSREKKFQQPTPTDKATNHRGA